jgi:hypothetical protein
MTSQDRTRAEARIIHDVAITVAAQYQLAQIMERVLAGDFDLGLEPLARIIAMRMKQRDEPTGH